MTLARRRRGVWTIALAIALSQAAVAEVGVRATDRSATAAEELHLLRWATERVELQLALAGSGKPYLVIDLPGDRMEIWFEGALLRRYPIVAARIASPRVAFIKRTSNIGPPLRRLEGLSLVPARLAHRLELHANDGGPPPPLPVEPPTPSEAVPAPPRYELRSADGLVLEIVADDVAARPTFAERLAEVAAALGLREVGAPRMRLALPAEEAAAFYRAAPPGVGALLILAIPESAD